METVLVTLDNSVENCCTIECENFEFMWLLGLNHPSSWEYKLVTNNGIHIASVDKNLTKDEFLSVINTYDFKKFGIEIEIAT